MAVTNVTAGSAQTYSRPQASGWFEAALIITMTWFVGGMFLDGWAHNQPNLVDTFFTPWHGVLYSGYVAVAAVLGGTLLRNMLRGQPLRQALPQGYGLAFVGIIIFACGAPLDLTWHQLFGFEESVEALLSPSHLLLACGAILFLTGPLRAAWARSSVRQLRGWRALAPALLGSAYLFALLEFFTIYVSPYTWPQLLTNRQTYQRYGLLADIQGITSILVPMLVLMLILTLLARSWELPAGSVTLFWGLASTLVLLERWRSAHAFWPTQAAFFGATLLLDGFIWRLRPSLHRLRVWRWFSFCTPALLTLTFLLSLRMTAGLVWSIHMWLGLSLICGSMGWLISLVAFPPASIPTMRSE